MLVTNPTNILYLCGFKSSNAALLVDPDRVRLFTDFRYSEAARAVEGSSSRRRSGRCSKDLAERLSGPVGFEADFVSYAGYETLACGSIEPVPRRGSRGGAPCSQGRGRARRHQGCLRDHRPRVRAARRTSASSAGTEREVAWTIEQLFHDEGAAAVAFETIVASGPNAARPHGRATERKIGAARP